MKNKGILFYSMVTICFVFILSNSIGCSLFDSPERATTNFLSLLKSGKQIEAQEHLSKDYRQLAVGLMGGVKNNNLKVYYRSDNLKNFEIVSIENGEKSARATVRLSTADGKTYTDQIDLVKEDGKWCIENF